MELRNNLYFTCVLLYFMIISHTQHSSCLELFTTRSNHRLSLSHPSTHSFPHSVISTYLSLSPMESLHSSKLNSNIERDSSCFINHLQALNLLMRVDLFCLPFTPRTFPVLGSNLSPPKIICSIVTFITIREKKRIFILLSHVQQDHQPPFE